MPEIGKWIMRPLKAIEEEKKKQPLRNRNMERQHVLMILAGNGIPLQCVKGTILWTTAVML